MIGICVGAACETDGREAGGAIVGVRVAEVPGRMRGEARQEAVVEGVWDCEFEARGATLKPSQARTHLHGQVGGVVAHGPVAEGHDHLAGLEVLASVQRIVAWVRKVERVSMAIR